ncbi:glycosyltransferase [Candidatus Pseudomonas adelgestsugas]|uniref:GalNAc(5)-diNAcBac-PP-undecaprenol beta-1,3-glucosyltransferase n=1 Tax=Candidatus Pseudomonas adelgestsugas TaxID=1302376 RepID=A0ABX5RA70_9PSED|nr:glycosyltransferase [Candidatus Pseudomonas adelgestsugas]QAX82161.1 GalNAc(5)-diNAcBac-PP-undecaprenol beta-1,3-glucosyltransferase [Candidatus Pseudomonas adelgestsugas]
MSNASLHFDVSVLLVTYNHELYIERTLNSLFSQDFYGSIELVVTDDASSDNTLQYIQRYEGTDARFTFKYLSPSANLGITKNYQRGFLACSSRYVAVLEGDDYWSSPYKLTRQTQFLDEHWECDLCSVNYFIYYENNASFVSRVKRGDGYRLLNARDLILDNLVGNFSTCLYRKSALEALPVELFNIQSYDWIINICVARSSLIGFIEAPMSVYRIHLKNAWHQANRTKQLEMQLSLIPTYDQLTNYVFHASFFKLQLDLRRALVLSRNDKWSSKVARAVAWSSANLEQFISPIVIRLFDEIIPPLIKKIILKILKP